MVRIDAIERGHQGADIKVMIDTMVYMLRNETTGFDSTHDSLNEAIDAVNDNVANGDMWIVQQSRQTRSIQYSPEMPGEFTRQCTTAGAARPANFSRKGL